MWIQLQGKLYNLEKICMITKHNFHDEITFYYTNHQADTECISFNNKDERDRVFNLIAGIIASGQSFFNFDAE